MIDKDKISHIVEEKLSGTSDYLTDVQVLPNNSIIVEIDNDEGVNMDTCASLSRFIESHFDREAEDFELTVTSAGLTSPFRTPRQYNKYVGKEVEVLTAGGVKHKGVLKSADEEGFAIVITKKVKPEGAKRKIEVEEELSFAYSEVKYTKYIIRF